MGQISRSDYKKSDDNFLRFFNIVIFLGLINLFNIYYPAFINNLLNVSIIGLGSIGITIYILVKKDVAIPKLLLAWLVFAFIMFIEGVLLGTHHKSIGSFIEYDWIIVVYTAIGFIYANQYYQIKFFKLMDILCIISLCIGIASIFSAGFNLYEIINRSFESNNFAYVVYNRIITQIYVYAYLRAKMQKKNRIIGYSLLILYLVMGVIFMKRSALIGGIFIVFITNCFWLIRLNTISKIKKIAFALLLFIIALLIISSLANNSIYNLLFNSFSQRFNSSNSTLTERQSELIYIWKKATIFEKTFGFGFGNYIYSYFTNISQYLIMPHIGYGSVIYKGGLMLCCFYFYIFINTIKCTLRINRISSLYAVYTLISWYTLYRMFYEFQIGVSVCSIFVAIAFSNVCKIDIPLGSENIDLVVVD